MKSQPERRDQPTRLAPSSCLAPFDEVLHASSPHLCVSTYTVQLATQPPRVLVPVMALDPIRPEPRVPRPTNPSGAGRTALGPTAWRRGPALSPTAGARGREPGDPVPSGRPPAPARPVSGGSAPTLAAPAGSGSAIAWCGPSRPPWQVA